MGRAGGEEQLIGLDRKQVGRRQGDGDATAFVATIGSPLCPTSKEAGGN